MKFIDGAHTSTKVQAVAEQLMFITKVPGASIDLKVQRGDDMTVVKLACSQGVCPSLELSNDVGDKCADDDHFPFFYNIVEGGVAYKPRPQRTDQPVCASVVTFNCSSVVISAARTLNFRLDEKVIGQLSSDLGPKPGDRIICPPVVFGQ
jgi:hypothetical protein